MILLFYCISICIGHTDIPMVCAFVLVYGVCFLFPDIRLNPSICYPLNVRGLLFILSICPIVFQFGDTGLCRFCKSTESSPSKISEEGLWVYPYGCGWEWAGQVHAGQLSVPHRLVPWKSYTWRYWFVFILNIFPLIDLCTLYIFFDMCINLSTYYNW